MIIKRRWNEYGYKKQSGFGKWASSRKGQQVIICAAFAIIPLLLLLVFTYIPFGEMVKFSFYKMKYTTPVEKREFVGLENYIDVFTRKDCFGALKLSLYYIVGALVQLVLALFLATLLSFKVKGGKPFQGIYFLPLSYQWYRCRFHFQILLHKRIRV